MNHAVDKPVRWLTMRDIMERTGYKRTKIYELRMQDPTFPKPINIGNGTGRHATLRWVESDLEEWMRRQASGA
ncbi:helix-turn-helix transcriptional regulator [Modicisalibacter coralii]|uniref:helix-turn-helix transcriptional regulator n=1 Tax=Modicisalibacter coralii TaxID=2304602 RepID=UPI00100A75B7|nr:AlpA family phage regulatory protein [Halomonas coralii]